MISQDGILSIRDLSIVLKDTKGNTQNIVSRVNLEVERGQTTALVGESGSGKTLLALSILNLLPTDRVNISSGNIIFKGMNLLYLKEKELCKLRGRNLAMIFQEPWAALSPLMTVGAQIAEVIKIHKGLPRSIIKKESLALLEMVGIGDPKARYASYPHQLSAGIHQRIMIAMALACRPEFLIADEPTSALDTTIQAQIVDLLVRLKRDLKMSVLLITNDMGVVAALSDRVAVLFGGQVIEEGTASQILGNPLHPYTQNLVAKEPTPLFTGPQGTMATIGAFSDNGAMLCPLIAQCPNVQDVCRQGEVPFFETDKNRKIRCFAYKNNRDGK